MTGKWKSHPKDLGWQVWCIYVRACWGQKAEMLKKCWFLKLFWRVMRATRLLKKVCGWASRGSFDVEKVIFRVKMLRVDMQDCASYLSGEYFFNKMTQNHRKSDANPEKIHRRSTEIGWPIENHMILHEHRRELKDKGAQENHKEATCSRNTHFSDVFLRQAWGTWSV